MGCPNMVVWGRATSSAAIEEMKAPKLASAAWYELRNRIAFSELISVILEAYEVASLHFSSDNVSDLDLHCAGWINAHIVKDCGKHRVAIG